MRQSRHGTVNTWLNCSFFTFIFTYMATRQLSGDTTVNDFGYFKVNGLFHIKFLKNGVWYGKSYYRLVIGNHTLAFDWCHFWWPWSTFEDHFSLGCHFHVHVDFSNPWHAFALHGLPAIAELLVTFGTPLNLPLQNEKPFTFTKSCNTCTRVAEYRPH